MSRRFKISLAGLALTLAIGVASPLVILSSHHHARAAATTTQAVRSKPAPKKPAARPTRAQRQRATLDVQRGLEFAQAFNKTYEPRGVKLAVFYVCQHHGKRFRCIYDAQHAGQFQCTGVEFIDEKPLPHGHRLLHLTQWKALHTGSCRATASNGPAA